MADDVALLRLLQALIHSAPIGAGKLAVASGWPVEDLHAGLAELRTTGIAIEEHPGPAFRLAEPVELLDRVRMLAALPERARFVLAGLEVLPGIDSTNAELLRRPHAEQHGLALFAERQSAGRGRHGRHWFSPLARNLYLSLGWRFESGLEELSGLPLLLALAAAEALQAQGMTDHGIKWPNDLLRAGRKLGGCLVQVQGDAEGPCLAVMGIGLNVRMPAGTEGVVSIDQPWTDVAGVLPDVSRNELGAALLTALLEHVQRFERQGLGGFMDAWNARDLLAGKRVEIQAPGARKRGVARGITAAGALRLDSADGLCEVQAGEASVLR